MLRGIPCYLTANGTSLDDYSDIKNLLKPYFTIGINRCFKLFDPTMLIWQDIELWMTERSALNKSKAIKYAKICSDPRGLAYHYRVLPGPFRLPQNPLVLFGHGATGPLAFQLAYSLGCSPIVLLGFDCKYKNSKTNFYGINRHHKEHTLKNCSRGLKWIKEVSKQPHIDVINCSDNDVFEERRDLYEVVNELKTAYPENTNREYFNKKIFTKSNI